MKILITNDDGIYADGLCGLYFSLKEEHEVFIVAPEVERSAVGHAITIHYPLRVREVRRGKFFLGICSFWNTSRLCKIGNLRAHRPSRLSYFRN